PAGVRLHAAGTVSKRAGRCAVRGDRGVRRPEGPGVHRGRLAHASFAGVAVALVSGRDVYAGGAAAAVFAALAISFISQRGRVRADTAIGVVFVAMLSFGVLVMSRLRNYSASIFEFLFGNV